MIFHRFADVRHPGDEDETPDTAQAVLDGVEDIEHEGDRRPDGIGDVAEGHDLRLPFLPPAEVEFQRNSLITGGASERFFDIHDAASFPTILPRHEIAQLSGQTFNGQVHLPGLLAAELGKGKFPEVARPSGGLFGIRARQIQAGGQLVLHVTGKSQAFKQEIVKTASLDIGAFESAFRQEFIHPFPQNFLL